MRTVIRNIYKTVRTTVRGETSRPWTVPARVTHLVIPADDHGRWVGPPVAIEAPSAMAAAEQAAVRTLSGQPYGFAEVPSNTFVIDLAENLGLSGSRLRGRYVRLELETQEYDS